jgi:hypothetical protein
MLMLRAKADIAFNRPLALRIRDSCKGCHHRSDNRPDLAAGGSSGPLRDGHQPAAFSAEAIVTAVLCRDKAVTKSTISIEHCSGTTGQNPLARSTSLTLGVLQFDLQDFNYGRISGF